MAYYTLSDIERASAITSTLNGVCRIYIRDDVDTWSLDGSEYSDLIVYCDDTILRLAQASTDVVLYGPRHEDTGARDTIMSFDQVRDHFGSESTRMGYSWTEIDGWQLTVYPDGSGGEIRQWSCDLLDGRGYAYAATFDEHYGEIEISFK